MADEKKCPSCGGTLVETTRPRMFKNPANTQSFLGNYQCSKCGVGVHRNVVDFERAAEGHRFEFNRGFGPYCDEGVARQFSDF